MSSSLLLFITLIIIMIISIFCFYFYHFVECLNITFKNSWYIISVHKPYLFIILRIAVSVLCLFYFILISACLRYKVVGSNFDAMQNVQ